MEPPKKRFEKRSIEYDAQYTPKRFKRPKHINTPDWYNRSFFLHLSLRQHPKPPVARQDVVYGAFDLNRKIGKELNLPFLYHGKIPYQSASNLLSKIAKTSWVQFQEPHSRNSYFSLREEPHSLEDMAKTYQHWCRQLAENDWKIYFAPTTPREYSPQPIIPPDNNEPITIEDNNDSECTVSVAPPPDHVERFYGSAFHNNANAPQFTRLSESVKLLANFVPKPKDPERIRILDRLPIPSYENPQQWSDILKVTKKGVFAIRKIPSNTPIGFYFGVPMSEDEYDALKYREGWSADFCLMYRNTVLDATDEKGQPITDITNRMFCPFHFMNETDKMSANVVLEEAKLQYQVVCWTRRDIQPNEELRAWFGSIQ